MKYWGPKTTKQYSKLGDVLKAPRKDFVPSNMFLCCVAVSMHISLGFALPVHYYPKIGGIRRLSRMEFCHTLCSMGYPSKKKYHLRCPSRFHVSMLPSWSEVARSDHTFSFGSGPTSLFGCSNFGKLSHLFAR